MADQGSSGLSFIPSSLPQTPPPAPRRSRGRLLLAGFVSAVLPGAGHLLINRRRQAVLLLLLFCVFLLICWPLRLPGHFAGVVLLVFGMIALCIFAAVNAPYVGRQHSEKPSAWWLAVLLPLAIVAAVIHVNWASRAAGFQVFAVPSSSMENTVLMGTRVMVDRWYYSKNTPARGDIIVYLDPQGLYLMKRVIARGDETIASTEGMIFVNDQPIPEPYVIHSGHAPREMNNFGPLKIPVGKLFVMGDNRDISLDSRAPQVGPIEATSLRGRPIYTLAGFPDNSSKILR